MVAILSKSERETLKALGRLSGDGQDAHTGGLARVASSFEHELPQEVEDRLYVAQNRALGEKVAHHIDVEQVSPQGGPTKQVPPQGGPTNKEMSA